MKLSQRQTCMPIRKFPYRSKIAIEKQREKKKSEGFQIQKEEGNKIRRIEKERSCRWIHGRTNSP
uniref:Uncharacterized protein n=1 Tax=Triticum urartu TaxID=4572 RepID=A0A8R7PRM4_TRIUA